MVLALSLCISLTLTLPFLVNSLSLHANLGAGNDLSLDKLIAIQGAERAHSDYVGWRQQEPRSLSNLTEGNVVFITVETRDNETDHVLPGPLGWSWTVQNLGAGQTWNGFISKVQYVQAFVETLPDDQLVAFVDGGDVMYAGCGMDFFQQRYKEVSAALGAPIVFSVEMACYEAPSDELCHKSDKHPKRKQILHQILHLNPRVLNAWNRGDSDCHPPLCGRLSYLNSGFYMGPAKDLREMYKLMIAASAHTYTGDQGWAWVVWRDHPELVGIDYTASLASSLYDFRPDIYEFQDFQWRNTRTHEPLCFFHGNGRNKTQFEQIEATVGMSDP